MKVHLHIFQLFFKGGSSTFCTEHTPFFITISRYTEFDCDGFSR